MSTVVTNGGQGGKFEEAETHQGKKRLRNENHLFLSRMGKLPISSPITYYGTISAEMPVTSTPRHQMDCIGEWQVCTIRNCGTKEIQHMPEEISRYNYKKHAVPPGHRNINLETRILQKILIPSSEDKVNKFRHKNISFRKNRVNSFKRTQLMFICTIMVDDNPAHKKKHQSSLIETTAKDDNY